MAIHFFNKNNTKLSDYFQLSAPQLINGYTYSFYSLILRIPDDLDLSQVKSISSFFQGMQSIKHIPNLDISKFTSAEYMFGNCKNLQDIPFLDTSNITTTANMFGSCYSLETIPLLDTSKCKDMSHMFQDCESLKTIPLLNTSNNKNFSLFVGMADRSKGSLIELPNLDTKSGTNFYGMCKKQSSLTTVPVFNLSNVSSTYNIRDMFYGCTSLSDESLNNIMSTLLTASFPTGTSNKTLSHIGLTAQQATKCTTLSNYQALVDAGWTTGY